MAYRRLRYEFLENRVLLSAQYDVTILGTLGGSIHSQGYAINASGQVAGNGDCGSGDVHAFLYSDGALRDLRVFGATNGSSTAYGVNDAGMVVGSAQGWRMGSPHAYYYDGVMHDLGIAGVARGVNNPGQIVGWSFTTDSGFLYDHGTVTMLAAPSGTDYSHAISINDRGQIVGYAGLRDGPTHAVVFDGGVWQYLFSDDRESTAVGINDRGQIIGWRDDSAYVYMSGKTVNLLDLATPRSINDAGQVVGGGRNGHAWLYSDGAEYDLNTLLVSGSGVTLIGASAINNRGQIVAYATNSTGIVSAVLLTPVAEGTTAVLTSAVVPSWRGYDAVFTATVAGVVPGTYPTGKVQFLDGTKLLASVSLANGVARYVTTPAAVGTHTVTARYVGNAEFAACMSRPVVLRLPATRLVAVSPTSVAAGVMSRFTIKAADAGGKVDTSFSGSITLTVASGPMTLTRTVKAVQGVATFNLQLSAGRYVLRAVATGLAQVLMPVTVTAARRPFWMGLITSAWRF